MISIIVKSPRPKETPFPLRTGLPLVQVIRLTLGKTSLSSFISILSVPTASCFTPQIN